MNHKLRIGALFQFGPHNLDKNIIWFKVTHRQRNLELIRTTTLKIIGLVQGNIKNHFMNRTWLSRNQVYFHVSICEGERTLTQRRARFFCKMGEIYCEHFSSELSPNWFCPRYKRLGLIQHANPTCNFLNLFSNYRFVQI